MDDDDDLDIDMQVDGGNPRERQEAIRRLVAMQRRIGALTRGMFRVTARFCACRRRRTDRQNRYYWPCFVKPLVEFLNDQGERTDDGLRITKDHVHDMFRAKFLRREIRHPRTRELLGFQIRSTTELTTVEFNRYLDDVAAWLARYVGIVVPEPDVYREPVGVAA